MPQPETMTRHKYRLILVVCKCTQKVLGHLVIKKATLTYSEPFKSSENY